MKKIFKLFFNIFIFFVLIVFGNNSIFANSGGILELKEKPKTIKELKENIEVLKSKKVINFSIFEKFKIEHGELQNYFSKNLTSEKFSEIEKIISNYKKEKELIKSSNNDDELNKLLDLEKEFYNSLIPYIDKNKIELFSLYIEKSLSTIKKEYEIKSKIKYSKKQINRKVSTIKYKIEENNKKQEEKINFLLKTKIKEKINKFRNSEKISKLSLEKQKLIFKLILKKIKIKKENTDNLSEKKLKLYSIIEEVLMEIIKEL